MDVLSQLRSHPLFSSFSDSELEALARAGSAVTYSAGEVCMRQGEPGEVFGVVISGGLEAVHRHDSPQREVLGPIGPGECFGEMSLLTGNPSVADVVAAEASAAIVFLQEAVGPILAGNVEAVGFLTRLMASRLLPERASEPVVRSRGPQYSLGASEPMRVLVVCTRQESVRYRYFDTTSEERLAGGLIRGLDGGRGVHTYQGPGGERTIGLTETSHEAAFAAMFSEITAPKTGVVATVSDLSAIGHRVCHGGLRYDGPVVVNEEVLAEIRRLECLSPIENPMNRLAIKCCGKLAPGVPQVAAFDTAFHLKLPAAATHYALPKDLAVDPELRRFGSHGISHEGAARQASKFLGIRFDAAGLVTCHLGSGASIAAIDHGRPVDNTMGATPLAGLVMATRCGDVDPGLLLHLICDRRIDPAELRRQLYTASGLLGLSGLSGDVLSVLEAADEGHERALLAIEVYCRRARQYLSSAVGLLRGADAIVFTGGVGENQPGIRARICQGLDWMDVRLDETRNRAARVGPGQVAEISAPRSAIRVLVAGGNEGHTIARQCARALSQERVTDLIRARHKPIPISPSAHHVHLTQEHVEALFGPAHRLTRHADLSQPGQFAAAERVALLGPKARIERVRVLGPVRSRTQVEIARTEEFKLGIDAPVRMSGDLDGTPGIVLEGAAGKVQIDRGVICAMRHIHMSPQEALELSVRDRDVVHVRVPGDRSLIFGDVMVRVHPDYRLDMHIDTDEANAAELSAGAVGELDSIQHRAGL